MAVNGSQALRRARARQAPTERKDYASMIPLDTLLTATNGILHSSSNQTSFTAFSHDSRQILSGEMFVAVRGLRGDGHDYLLDALERGAAGLLVEERIIDTLPKAILTRLEQANVATIIV